MAMNFEEMSMRWGEVIASYLLHEIEKASMVISNANIPPQERLDRAVKVQQDRTKKV